MAITYLEVPRQETVTIKVKLDGKQVGKIKHTHRGWEYFPKGSRSSSVPFSTLAAVKQSLEGLKPDYSKTYWCNKGKHEELAKALRPLIPASGPVPNFPDEPEKNKALETYRIAVNCYYDLYNNGLCNRAQEFLDTFGFEGKEYRDPLTQDLIDRTESKMDEIILAAYAEQFPPVPPSPRPLTDAETATILCALRNHQVNPEWHEVEPQDRLSDAQIDTLCDTISTSGAVKIA